MLTCNKLSNQPKIAIIHPNKSAYSETFIRSHIEKLPAQVEEINYGSWHFPIYKQNECTLLEVDLGSKLQRLTQRKLLKKTPAFFQIQALINFLQSQKIEAVLAEYGPTGVCVMDACQAANVPLVVHFHGMDAYDSSVLKEFGAAYRVMFERASTIVAVSHAMEQQLINIGAFKDKLVCNPCGVDVSLFIPKDINASGPHFVTVGRFVDKKAPYLTLLAFQKAIRVCPEAKLTMIGDGYLLEACKQIAKTIGIANNVEFKGSVNHQEVTTILKSARAFLQHSVQTSYGDSEGTPVAVLEAGAAGLPVISTKHAGIPDVVIHDQTGFLVQEGDVEGMAQAIITLAKDIALASKLGKAARERISNHFSMTKSIDNLWNSLNKSIQNHQKSQLQAS